MSRSSSRVRAAVAVAVLALLIVVPSTLADSVYWTSGKHGAFDVVDTSTKPGATCTATGFGVYLKAREPRVRARDRSAGVDVQTVGWQVILQRMQPGTGWTDLVTSPTLTATATDTTPAVFPGVQQLSVGSGTSRIVDILMWYAADGTTVVGAVDSRVTFYREAIAGVTITAYGACAG